MARNTRHKQRLASLTTNNGSIHSPQTMARFTHHKQWLDSLATNNCSIHSPQTMARFTHHKQWLDSLAESHAANPRRGVWGNLGSPIEVVIHLLTHTHKCSTFCHMFNRFCVNVGTCTSQTA
jgi:hypothetical protein